MKKAMNAVMFCIFTFGVALLLRVSTAYFLQQSVGPIWYWLAGTFLFSYYIKNTQAPY